MFRFCIVASLTLGFVLALGFNQDVAAKSAKAAKPKKTLKLDTNGDGKIDASEREAGKQALLAAREAAKAEAKAKADAKRKAKASKASSFNPAAAAKTAREAKLKEMLAKYDTNKDGKLDNTEAAKAMQELRGKRGSGGRR